MAAGTKVHGHLMHPYEDWDLTFGELKEMLTDIAEGNLRGVSEKFDGINIVFTYDVVRGLRFARSATDIKNGGGTADELIKRWATHSNPLIAKSIKEAYAALSIGLRNLSPQHLNVTFLGGSLWHTAEIVYADNPNVIHYKHNCIVFHDRPQFHLNADSSVKDCSEDYASQIASLKLTMCASSMDAWAPPPWVILDTEANRPVMQPIQNPGVLQNSLNIIESLQGSCGLDDSARLGDFYQKTMEIFTANKLLRPNIQKLVASRLLGYPGCPGLPRIKSAVTPEAYLQIKALVAGREQLLDFISNSIETAVYDVGVEAMRSMKSCLVLKDDNAERINKQLRHNVSQLRAGIGPHKLMRQVWKLQRAPATAPAIEGVVFRYAGKSYKLTGNFAPINQLLGAFRYNR
jgi:hypothetical protein